VAVDSPLPQGGVWAVTPDATVRLKRAKAPWIAAGAPAAPSARSVLVVAAPVSAVPCADAAAAGLG
jgi:hypothetical protein